MGNEPKPKNAEPEYTPDILRNPEFIADVRRLEQLINDSMLDGKEFELLTKEVVSDLDDLFGDGYFEKLIDVVGEAYVSDDEGDLTGEELYLFADGIVYIGIDVVYVRSMAKYEIVFRFADVVFSQPAEGTGEHEIQFCIPIEQCVKFVPSKAEQINNDYLLTVLAAHANRSEDIVQAPSFLTSSTGQQLETLNVIATETEYDVMGICGDDLVAVDADIFYVVSASTDGSVFTLVDQSEIPQPKRQMPVGRPDGCTFKEYLTTNGISPIKGLEYQYPSLIVTDDEKNLVYLVPIRALKAVHLVTDSVA